MSNSSPKPKYAWIWPKDPRPGNPSRWSWRWRFLDVLLGRGPDIYVGRIDRRGGLKGRGHCSSWRECCCCCCCCACSGVDVDGDTEVDVPFPTSRANERKRKRRGEKYDCRTGRYTMPDDGSWSGVEYCDCRGRQARKEGRRHEIPRKVCDCKAPEYPADECCDTVYGVD